MKVQSSTSEMETSRKLQRILAGSFNYARYYRSKKLKGRGEKARIRQVSLPLYLQGYNLIGRLWKFLRKKACPVAWTLRGSAWRQANLDRLMIRHLWICILVFVSLPALAQQQYAVPKTGEGISAFLERNGRPGKTYYKEFIRLNKKRLNGKEQLLLGVRYALPPLHDGESGADTADCGDKSLEVPLFGRENAHVRVTDSRLKGACFYVVSGHGGPDPGAIGHVGKYELHEDEYAYDVALRLARNLMQEGAEVRIIIQDAKDGIRDDRYLSGSKRETCMGDRIPLGQVERLRQRCQKINALYVKDQKRYKYCRAIFLHVDSRSRSAQTDVFFYHAPKSTKGERLANRMKRTFGQKYGRHQPNRGFRGTVSSRRLYVLLNATPISVFVELGNIQNTFDQRRFVLSSNRQALAKWMTEGFIADYRKSK